MRIRLCTASASVHQALTTLLAGAGHEIETGNAELCLVDSMHPVEPPIDVDTLYLVAASSAALDPAQDAIACPIRPAALLQHITQRAQTRQITLGYGWMLASHRRTLLHPAQGSLTLTEKETQLLRELAEAAPEPIGRELLLAQVWGMNEQVDTHTLETHIYRLRSKLESLVPTPCQLVTINGAYMLAFEGKSG